MKCAEMANDGGLAVVPTRDKMKGLTTREPTVANNPWRLFSWRSELLFAGDAFSLVDGHDLASGHPREIFAFAIRPAYRYVGRDRFAQTEVQAEVALRHEGTTAVDLVNLLVTARG